MGGWTTGQGGGGNQIATRARVAKIPMHLVFGRSVPIAKLDQWELDAKRAFDTPVDDLVHPARLQMKPTWGPQQGSNSSAPARF
eukprot:3872128-Pyramimonas_sp.AAC.2